MKLPVFLSALMTLAAAGTAQAQAQIPRPPQYILISFDGSYTNAMWQATREHGLQNGARYTHFISGVDFLIGSSKGPIPGETRHIYTPPKATGLCSARNPKCQSDVGFGGTKDLITERIRQVSLSAANGMEISAHGNSHFNGSTWNTAEWTHEFNWFHKIMLEVFSINKIKDGGNLPNQSAWQDMMLDQMHGIRAPYLAHSPGMFETLGKTQWDMLGRTINHRYSYDASTVSAQLSAWPTQRANGVWVFPLVQLPVPGRTKAIISMDYNFYVSQSGDKDDLVNAPKYEEQMYQAYVNWFTRNYHGNRAPLNIGHHFSTWNGGAYWRALKRFVGSVCTQPEVRCVTYKEMVDALEEGGLARQLPALNKGQFSQANRPRVEIPFSTRVAFGSNDGSLNNVVSGGRFAKLPNSKFRWMLNGKLLADGADLVQLAKEGNSYIQAEEIATGKKINLLIDWNAHLDSAKLRMIEMDDSTPCSSGAHLEKVNPSFINGNNPLDLI